MRISTRSKKIRSALAMVMDRMSRDARDDVDRFVTRVLCSAGYESLGLTGPWPASAALFPLWTDITFTGDPEGQIVFFLPVCRLISQGALVSVVAHELAHAVEASRLGSSWHELMQKDCDGGERRADALATNWGFGECIRQLKLEREKVIEPCCIMLGEPFFWDRPDWIPAPAEFKHDTQVGKGFDSEGGPGKTLWKAVCEQLSRGPASRLEQGSATEAAIESRGFGRPQIKYPRLGQGLFRILVTAVYTRRCAITGGRTLPALEAAHIKPYSLSKRHEVPNGLQLRADLHKLFDDGYLTVDPKGRRIIVSRRIREEFENGRDYYRLEGLALREPSEQWARPSDENLECHAYNVFR